MLLIITKPTHGKKAFIIVFHFYWHSIRQIFSIYEYLRNNYYINIRTNDDYDLRSKMTRKNCFTYVDKDFKYL
jgi:hypothetical protein